MSKYLITGGAGFIGSNIVKKLLDLGESIRVVDNFSTGRKENIQEFFGNLNFEFLEGDLTDLAVAKKSVKGVNFILHEAAVPSIARSIEDPIRSNDANIRATLNILIAAKEEGVKKFIYASSSSIYGDAEKSPKKEDFPINPISPYALTKYAGERYCQLFWRIHKLPTISLRYFNVFGPKQNPDSQYSAVIPKFILALLKKESPVIYGSGEQSRDFTYIANVVAANLLAIKAEKGFGEVYNIACGKETNLNELFSIINRIIGSDIKPDYKEFRQGDLLKSRADITKAKKVLNYSPVVDLKEGLKNTVEWLRKYETF